MSEKPHFENLAELAEDLKQTPEIGTGEQHNDAQAEKVEAAPAPEHEVASLHEAVKEAFEDSPADTVSEHLQEAEKAASEPASAPASASKYVTKLETKRALKGVQAKEKAADRALSKVVHQDAVRAVSEVASKSVSRPSGLLGGGIVAFLGSTSYLILAKHLGFTYNSSVMLVLFIAGFALGLLMELAAHALNHRTTSSRS